MTAAAVLGVTGGTGRLIVEQALSCGHRVTSPGDRVVQWPAKASASHHAPPSLVIFASITSGPARPATR